MAPILDHGLHLGEGIGRGVGGDEGEVLAARRLGAALEEGHVIYIYIYIYIYVYVYIHTIVMIIIL